MRCSGFAAEMLWSREHRLWIQRNEVNWPWNDRYTLGSWNKNGCAKKKKKVDRKVLNVGKRLLSGWNTFADRGILKVQSHNVCLHRLFLGQVLLWWGFHFVILRARNFFLPKKQNKHKQTQTPQGWHLGFIKGKEKFCTQNVKLYNWITWGAVIAICLVFA